MQQFPTNNIKYERDIIKPAHNRINRLYSRYGVSDRFILDFV